MTDLLRKAVDAYEAKYCEMHGQTIKDGGMSEENKRSIAPMIEAAILVVIKDIVEAALRFWPSLGT